MKNYKNNHFPYSQQIVSLVLSLSSINETSLWDVLQLSGILCLTLG